MKITVVLVVGSITFIHDRAEHKENVPYVREIQKTFKRVSWSPSLLPLQRRFYWLKSYLQITQILSDHLYYISLLGLL